jgi:dihydroorotase
LRYKAQLEKLEPNVTFLMSLYLHPDVTAGTIIQAKKAGITGVKSYPAGVTTNSSAGVIDYESFYPVFEEMERQDMILNLHGETPRTPRSDITVLNAEERFLPTLLDLHERFPKLRIILEHCTTAAAIEAVKQCGPTVAATITAHHLFLIVDDWAGDPHCFCKPVAKTPDDRKALLRTGVSSNPKIFFGSDSAPHPVKAKTCGDLRTGKAAAGVFTQPYATQYVLTALEEACEEGIIEQSDITKEKLQGFLGDFGRKFYGVEDKRQEQIRLVRGEETVQAHLGHGDVEVIPFKRSSKLGWKIVW